MMRAGRERWGLRSGAGLVVTLMAGCGPASVGSSEAPPLLESALPLVAAPAVLDLGIVRLGETRRGTIVVRNRTDRTVEVARVETSCAYVGINPDPFPLEAGEWLTLSVRVDPEESRLRRSIERRAPGVHAVRRVGCRRLGRRDG